MKIFRILSKLILFVGFFQPCFAQYITVSENLNLIQLVNTVFSNNSCAEISNISFIHGGISGARSYGYFTNGNNAFPFNDGIILSTGLAKSAIGPNNSLLSEGQTFWLGDNDLEAALGLSGTFNATVLEFDFRPLTDKISFEYLFASEQYLSNPSQRQCGFTDGFAFLLKEANTSNPYKNLAIVPGTTLPVTVSNIRGSGTICPAQNEQYFDAFNNFEHPTNFNGQTKTLIAKSDVIAGNLYHIKLVIADEGNEKYDSAIFLKGGSFNIGTNLGIDKLVANQNPLCQGEVFTLNATQAAATSYKWYKDGNPILDLVSGLPITLPTYQVTDSGTYKVEVVINTLCTSEDEIVIQYVPLPTVNDTNLFQCDGDLDGVVAFDLTKVKNSITGNNSQLIIENYYKNRNDAENLFDAIPNPTSFTNAISNSVFARIKNQFGCVAFAKIDLAISNNPLLSTSFKTCDTFGNQDGKTSFSQQDFDIITNQLLVNQPSGLVVSFFLDAGFLQLISLPYTNDTALQQLIYAKATNGSNCFGFATVTLNITTFSPANFETQIVGICSGVPKKISVASGFSSYVWTPPNPMATNEILVTTANTYTVEVTNNEGCKATKVFVVEASQSASIQNIAIDDFNGNSNTVLINYSGNGDYEFSLDGINFQESPMFDAVPAGEYTVIVNDKKGCLPVSSSFFVLTYPTFFTPNNDGFNDVWKIKNIQTKPNSQIQLYNRYGKLLGNLNTDTGWNGKFNQQEVPADDYWFVLTLENQKQIKGHFALKR
jgi:gliding motility-associated-like protein